MKALLFAVFLASALFAFSQQTTAPSELDRRIERQVRAYTGVPPDVKIIQGVRTPSKFPGYDNLPVTIDGNAGKKTIDFLIARDGSNLLYLTEIDLNEDPYAKNIRRIDLKDRPFRGAENAPVTVVVFDDFECPFCSKMYVTLFNEVMSHYRDRVKVVMKDFPILDAHPWAMRAAVDAHCLADQNLQAYWDFSDYVHTHQGEVSAKFRVAGVPDPKAIDGFATASAEKHGVKPEPLQACIARQDDSRVQSSIAEARSLDIGSTPTMFVNGQEIDGVITPESLRLVLDRALAEASGPRAGQ